MPFLQMAQRKVVWLQKNYDRLVEQAEGNQLAFLVGAAPNDRVARAVISSIVRMAGDLGVQTVAESVESDSELQAMRALGVDFAQGFLVGRPQSLTGYLFPTDIN